MDKYRIDYIDVMKAIGILFVMFFHIYSGEFIREWLNIFQLPIFLFTAGLVFHEVTFTKFLSKKTKALIIPYLVWGGVTLCYYFLIESRMRSLELSFWDCVLKGIILGEYTFLNFNSPLWFLPCFFVVSFVFLVIYKLVKIVSGSKAPELCLIVTSILYLLSIIFPMNLEVWSLYKAPKFLFYYACGFMLQSLNNPQNILYDSKKFRWILPTLSVTMYVMSAMMVRMGAIDILVEVLGIFGTLCLSMAVSNSKVLKYIGARTLTIMVIHGPIYRVIVYGIGKATMVSTEIVRGSFIMSLIASCATLFLCLCVDILATRGKQALVVMASKSK